MTTKITIQQPEFYRFLALSLELLMDILSHFWYGINIGISEYELGYRLLTYKSQNQWKQRIKKNRNPIPLLNGSDKAHFETILNKLLVNLLYYTRDYVYLIVYGCYGLALICRLEKI